jgi:putative DNA primase/helicase
MNDYPPGFSDWPLERRNQYFAKEASAHGERKRKSNGAGEHEQKGAKIIMGTEIKPESIAWLWRDWLAFGKLHILAGRPGTLKTTTALSLSASVTIGGAWPDGSPAAAGNVIMWSGEDAIKDTLLPRFLAAGGDPARVGFVGAVTEDGKDRSFDPARAMDALADVCARLGDVNLVIVDPIAAIARQDSHKNAETRRDLQPVVDLAERTAAAVLGIHHLTKRSEDADPLDRVSGSLAFGAGPRAVFLTTLDRKAAGEPRGVLMCVKSNIGPSHGGIEFTAETRPLDNYPSIAAQRILWGEFVDKSARDILEETEGKEEQAERKNRKAVAFLSEALKAGPRTAAEVTAEGAAAGLSERALQRAFKDLKGHSERVGFGKGGAWVWELSGEAS